jgi:hypothetical protein
VAVADHQPPAALIHLSGVRGNVGGNLGLRSRREHPAGAVWALLDSPGMELVGRVRLPTLIHMFRALLRREPRRGARAAHCASVRSCRLGTARVATRSPVHGASWSLYQVPETSSVIDHRHATTFNLSATYETRLSQTAGAVLGPLPC